MSVKRVCFLWAGSAEGRVAGGTLEFEIGLTSRHIAKPTTGVWTWLLWRMGRQTPPLATLPDACGWLFRVATVWELLWAA